MLGRICTLFVRSMKALLLVCTIFVRSMEALLVDFIEGEAPARLEGVFSLLICFVLHLYTSF